MDIPTLLHKENLEQRQKWQVFSFAMIAVIVIETMLICFLSVKLADKKEVIRYVEFSKKGDFGFKVLPESNLDLSQQKLLIAQQLQQYVVDRVSNVVSKKSGSAEIEAPKIQFVFALSSREVHSQYQSELMRIYNEADFIKREIQILSSSEIEDRKYRFDFKTIDILPNDKINEQRWVVYLKYDLLDPNELKVNEHKEINPLGIKITYYRGDVDRKQKVDVRHTDSMQQQKRHKPKR
jgi:type IV secretory pathway component VirB8